MKTKFFGIITAALVLFAGFHGITKPHPASAALDAEPKVQIVMSIGDSDNSELIRLVAQA